MMMSKFGRHIGWTLIFLVFASVVIAALDGNGQLRAFFNANPGLNGLICALLLVGILYSFRQFFLLTQAAEWINRLARRRAGEDVPAAKDPPVLLTPLASYFDGGSLRGGFKADDVRVIGDAIYSRLTEARDTMRYLMGLLIFLGLLGTFWGLLQTLAGLADLIAGLDLAAEDIGPLFASLITGLERPLSGMGTAFSSSLFGLGGSLILGFIDLQTASAQNRFANDMEEWLLGMRGGEV